MIRDSFNWLPTLSDEEFWSEVELIEGTGNDALDAEPDNWRILALMVLLHQTAAERDDEYVAKARAGLEKMAAIAPNLPDTRILTEQQDMLEGSAATP